MSLDSLATSIRKALRRPRLELGTILQTLRELLGTRDVDLLEGFEPCEFSLDGEDDLPGYANYVRTVQHVLAAHASCKCTQGKEESHWTRLRLKPVYEMLTEDLVPFDMLFSVEPNPASPANMEWQGVHILVPTKKPQVSFLVDPDKSTKPFQQSKKGADNCSDSEEVSSLCSLIASRCGAVLCMKVVRQRLRVLRETPEHLYRVPRTAGGLGLHLGQVIDKFNLGYGMRPVLAYALAKAVWYHYDSDWIGVSIANNGIYFLGEGNDEDPIYFCKPYLPVKLQASQDRAAEYKAEHGLLHRYPRVLALGIMIMELATGQHVEVEGHPESWTPRVSNDQLIRLQDLVDNVTFQDDCKFPNYITVVRNCLDPRIFSDAPCSPSDIKGNLERRRNILYEKVVDPLRQLVKGTGWDKHIEEFERTPLVPKLGRRTNPPHVVTTTLPGNRPTSPVDHLTPSIDPWLEDIAEFNRMVSRERSKAGVNAKPIRIAILDTGYDENAPTFDIPVRASRIKGWRDFVLRSRRPVDIDGHGTHLLTLLLQIECSAHIYVARVTEHELGLATAEDNVAEAIRVAAVEWDVDFVSMSFGFPRYVQKIGDAMECARSHKKSAIVFLAAANNDGLNSGEMFPASLGESGNVIPIRGTNRHGRFDERFDPETFSTPAFGTLGSNVYSDWQGEDLQRSMSGCSVATPIALSLAVMVIDYAANHPAEFSPDDLRILRTRRGVIEIFKGMYACKIIFVVPSYALLSTTNRQLYRDRRGRRQWPLLSPSFQSV